MDECKTSLFEKIAICTILLISLFLRIYHVDSFQLWEDDILSLDRATMPVSQMLTVQKLQSPSDTIFDFQPPLYYSLLRVALLINDSSYAARCVGIITGVLSVFGIYLLGRLLFSNLAGIISSFILSCLILSVSFSQSLKHYGVFICFLIYSSYFFINALKTERYRSWVAYVLATLSMLYSAYQGIPCFLSQIAFGSFYFYVHARGHWPSLKNRRVFIFLGSLFCVVLGYIPWIPGVLFLTGFLSNASVDPFAGITIPLIQSILVAFIARREDVHLFFIAIWLAAFILGIAVTARGNRRMSFVFLLIWGGASIGSLILNKTDFRMLLGARHFAGFFPVWIIFTACGIEWVCRLLSRIASTEISRSSISNTSAVILSGILLLPTTLTYGDYYNGRLSYDKDLFRWISDNKNNIDSILFSGYKTYTKLFSARWYLGELFNDNGTWDAPSYRRMFVVDTHYKDTINPRPIFPDHFIKSFNYMVFTSKVSAMGVASRAPIVMTQSQSGTFQYNDDFTTIKYLQDCYKSNNMTLDIERGALRPLRYSQPAQLTYAFVVPKGSNLRKATTSISWGMFHRHPNSLADSKFTIEVSDDGVNFQNVGVLEQRQIGRLKNDPCPFFDEADYYNSQCNKYNFTYEFDTSLLQSNNIFLRISYFPGIIEGYIFLNGVKFDSEIDQQDTNASNINSLEQATNNLILNNRVTKWSANKRLIGRGLYCFVQNGFEHLALGAPVNLHADLDQFLSEHPDAVPVYDLLDAHGNVALTLYDPLLSSNRTSLFRDGQQEDIQHAGSIPFEIGSVTFRGAIDSPSLIIDNKQVDFPVIAPYGSTLTINPGRDGRITFIPDWSSQNNLKRSLFHESNVHISSRLRNEVNCKTADNCSFSYIFVSAFPIKSLRYIVLPHVYKNPCQKCPENIVTTSLSTDDGKTYTKLTEHSGWEECSWSRPGYNQAGIFNFDKPTTSCILKFDMQTQDQAGFLSPADNLDGMFIEADLDTSILPKIILDKNNFKLTANTINHSDVEIFFADKPQQLSTRLAP